ncbi:C2H2 type domain-containing protein [Hexamita inflata]|uniref:C2H2 type domain-containing protein n=1 Tax=Hexamita inflata TaxID=28002 RepID=A0ABP1H9Z1_9EUKA
MKCTECPKSFNAESQLKIHMRTHTNERPFSCEKCGKAFTQKNNLTKHSQIHGEAKFECTICNKMFSAKQNLNRHEEVHNSKFIVYNCQQCDKQFATKYNLEHHAISHKAQFRCNSCNTFFNNVQQYSYHKETKHEKIQSKDSSHIEQRCDDYCQTVYCVHKEPAEAFFGFCTVCMSDQCECPK